VSGPDLRQLAHPIDHLDGDATQVDGVATGAGTVLAFSITVGRKPQRLNQYARLGPAMLAPEISTVSFM
jgi:hypothetical protein